MRLFQKNKKEFFQISRFILPILVIFSISLVVFNPSFQEFNYFWNSKPHSKTKAKSHILTLNATDGELDTIFNDIKSHLKKITTYDLESVGNSNQQKGVSVLKLAKITAQQWTSIDSRATFKQRVNQETYQEFSTLVSIFKTTEAIKTKINDAIKTKLDSVFNATKSNLQKIAIYGLSKVDEVNVDELAKIADSEWTDITIKKLFENTKKFGSSYEQFTNLVEKFKDKSRINQKITDAVATWLDKIFATTKINLTRIEVYRLSSVGGVGVGKLAQITQQQWTSASTRTLFKTNHKPAHTEFDNLVKRFKTAPAIRTKIAEAIEVKLNSIFTDVKVDLKKITTYGLVDLGYGNGAVTQLARITAQQWNAIDSVSDLKSNNERAYGQFSNLVANHKTAGAIKTKINWAVDFKLILVFEFFLKDIITYDLSAVDGASVTEIAKITESQWNAIKSISDLKSNHPKAYEQIKNLVARNKTTAKINEKIAAAVTAQLDAIFTATRTHLIKIAIYDLTKVDKINVSELAKLTESEWNSVSTRVGFKTNHRSAHTEFENLVKRLKNAKAINDKITEIVDNKLNIIFVAVKTNLVKITTYGLDTVDTVDVSELAKLTTHQWASVNSGTTLKYSYPLAYAQFSILSGQQKASEINQKINEAVTAQLDAIFAMTKDNLKKIINYDLSTVATVVVSELAKLTESEWNSVSTRIGFKTNHRLAYIEFENLVKRLKNAKAINDKITEIVDNKLNIIFAAVKTNLMKITTYELGSVDTVDVSELAKLTAQQWTRASTRTLFKTNHKPAYTEFENLVKRLKNAAAINEKIQAAIVKKVLAYLWAPNRRVSVKALFNDIYNFGVTVIAGVNIAVLRTLNIQIPPRGDVEDWDGLVMKSDQNRKIVQLLDALNGNNLANKFTSFQTAAHQAIIVTIRLNDLFVVIKPALSKIATYGLDKIAGIAVDELAKITIDQWKNINTGVVFQMNFPAAYRQLSNLLAKYQTALTINQIINDHIVRNILSYLWKADRATTMKLFEDIDNYQIKHIVGVDVSVLWDLKAQLDKGSLDWNAITTQQSAQIVELLETLNGNNVASKFITFKNIVKQTKMQLNTIFTTVKPFLVKLNIAKLDGVDVSQLQKISDWKPIQNLDHSMTKYSQAFEQFVNLVQRYRNYKDPAQKIIAVVTKTLSQDKFLSSGLTTETAIAIATTVPLFAITMLLGGGYFYYKYYCQKPKSEAKTK